MHQEENYKNKLNVKGNGVIYKEFKLRNTNWIVMFSFCKSPFSLSKGINCSIFHGFQHVLYHSMHQKKNYKVCFNVRSNGAAYKEFKLKNTNWTIMFSFCKSPSSLSKGTTCSFIHRFQHFLYHWMCQVENYKIFWKLKNNRTMYQKL
jgi:hypothetical protein